MQATALLVIDVQKSFEQMPFWNIEGLDTYRNAQNDLIAHARASGWPVVFIYHQSRGAFAPDGGFVEAMEWVDRQPSDPVFYKRVHNALTESGLEPYLQKLGITRLVISGIRTEQCCETTARVASDSGYEVDYILDATHTFPMALADDSRIDRHTILQHTAMVLRDRFAVIWQASAFIEYTNADSINSHCPRSGRLVSPDSLTEYRGHTVGFCNTGCRDSFSENPSKSAMDCLYFDRIISRQAIARAYL